MYLVVRQQIITNPAACRRPVGYLLVEDRACGVLRWLMPISEDYARVNLLVALFILDSEDSNLGYGIYSLDAGFEFGSRNVLSGTPNAVLLAIDEVQHTALVV